MNLVGEERGKNGDFEDIQEIIGWQGERGRSKIKKMGFMNGP